MMSQINCTLDSDKLKDEVVNRESLPHPTESHTPPKENSAGPAALTPK